MKCLSSTELKRDLWSLFIKIKNRSKLSLLRYIIHALIPSGRHKHFTQLQGLLNESLNGLRANWCPPQKPISAPSTPSSSQGVIEREALNTARMKGNKIKGWMWNAHTQRYLVNESNVKSHLFEYLSMRTMDTGSKCVIIRHINAQFKFPFQVSWEKEGALTKLLVWIGRVRSPLSPQKRYTNNWQMYFWQITA